jgi:hypothetical protein
VSRRRCTVTVPICGIAKDTQFTSLYLLPPTGELRNSISFTVTVPGKEAWVASSDPAYQELGTATIPPRPFLSGAAAHEEKEIRRMVRDVVGGAMSMRSLTGHLAEHFVRELKHLGGEIRDDWRELIAAGEDPNRATKK